MPEPKYIEVLCSRDNCNSMTRIREDRLAHTAQWVCLNHEGGTFDLEDKSPLQEFVEVVNDVAQQIPETVKQSMRDMTVTQATPPKVELEDIERACIEAARDICNIPTCDGSSNAYMLTAHPGSETDEEQIKRRIFKEVKPIAEALVQKQARAFDLVGKWLSAALDDPKVCDEMKADIRKAFELRGPVEEEAPTQPGSINKV